AVLTYDDGYRNFFRQAYPILKEAQAPFTVYVTTGFVEGTARLWWMELEAAILAATTLSLPTENGTFEFSLRTREEKETAGLEIYKILRTLDEPSLLERVSDLMQQAGLTPENMHRLYKITQQECMNWEELIELSQDPLCTIGAHTLT